MTTDADASGVFQNVQLLATLPAISLSIAPPGAPPGGLLVLTGAYSATPQVAAARVGDEVGVSDFFFVRHDFFLSPEPLVADAPDDKGWYVRQYRVRCYPLGTVSAAGAQVLSTSPENANNDTQVSVGTSFSLGASAGAFGGTPTGDLNAGYSWSNSKSYDVTDVTLENVSRDATAEWTFTMPFPDAHTPAIDPNYIDEVKPLQRDRFEPTVCAVWRVPGGSDTPFVLKTELEVTFARSSIPPGASGAATVAGEIAMVIPLIGVTTEEVNKQEATRADALEVATQTFDVAIPRPKPG